MRPTNTRAFFAGLLLLPAAALAQTATRPPVTFAEQRSPAPARAAPACPDERPQPPQAAAAPRADSPAAPALGLAPRIDALRYQADADGTLWARGGNYKLRFDSRSAAFVPFFSSRAPRNFELAFDLRAVTVNGRALPLTEEADLGRAGDVVTLDHGAVDEQYVLELERVEQRFVLRSLPERGELALRLGVATELEGALLPEGGFEFSNAWGSVLYGSATAVDARGRRLALESRLAQGEIEIVVPAGFTATAALPLVIDPIVAAYGVDSSASIASSPDLAFDRSGGGLMHCYEVVYSATDHDVLATATDRWGNVWAGSTDWVDFTTAYWARPRIAHNGQTDRFLIAAEVGLPITNARSIWGVVRSVFQTTISGQFELSGPESGDKYQVDVGGDPWGWAPSYFLAVYVRKNGCCNTDIDGRLIDPSGAVVASVGTLPIDSHWTIDDSPSVSKSNNASTWNVAWQRDDGSASDDIMGARVTWYGAVSYPTFTVAAGSLPEEHPSVSSSISGTERFLVVGERDYTSDRDIVAYGVNGNVVEASLNVSIVESSWLLQDQRQPAIDCDGAHFGLYYSELHGNSATDYDVLATELQWNANGIGVRERHKYSVYSNAPETDPQVASPESSNPANTTADYAGSFLWRGSYVGISDDIWASLFAGSSGGEVASFCSGSTITCPCGNGNSASGCPNSAIPIGAIMLPGGAASTSADTLNFSTVNMPPYANALVFQGTAMANGGWGFGVGDGVRCVGGQIRRFTVQPSDASGNIYFPQAGGPSISAAGGVPLMGGTCYYQTWYRDPVAFCNNGTTNLSNALMVNWTP